MAQEKPTRIMLVKTSDIHTRLTAGSEGTLLRSYVDSYGDERVAVKWDDGSTLTLISPWDDWTVLDPHD